MTREKNRKRSRPYYAFIVVLITIIVLGVLFYVLMLKQQEVDILSLEQQEIEMEKLKSLVHGSFFLYSHGPVLVLENERKKLTIEDFNFLQVGMGYKEIEAKVGPRHFEQMGSGLDFHNYVYILQEGSYITLSIPSNSLTYASGIDKEGYPIHLVGSSSQPYLWGGNELEMGGIQFLDPEMMDRETHDRELEQFYSQMPVIDIKYPSFLVLIPEDKRKKLDISNFKFLEEGMDIDEIVTRIGPPHILEGLPSELTDSPFTVYYYLRSGGGYVSLKIQDSGDLFSANAKDKDGSSQLLVNLKD